MVESFLNPREIMNFEDGDPTENPWVAGKPELEEIEIEEHSPKWAKIYEFEKFRIAAALPGVALHLEHIGSTAVLGLSAKPIIDIDLVVGDPDQEENYVRALSSLGYVLTIRELTWYRHRMLRHVMPRINLHVWGPDCPEHFRHILFRDWLCSHPEDRERYADIKLKARLGVESVEEYNRNKQSVLRAIYMRIFVHHGWEA